MSARTMHGKTGAVTRRGLERRLGGIWQTDPADPARRNNGLSWETWRADHTPWGRRMMVKHLPSGAVWAAKSWGQLWDVLRHDPAANVEESDGRPDQPTRL